MKLFVLVCIAVGTILSLGIAAMLLFRGGDKELRQRLRRVSEPLSGHVPTDEPAAETDIFLSSGRRPRISRSRRFIESRYPLLKASRTVPRAVGIGLVAATGLWFSMSFLKIPFGWWSMPVVAVFDLTATWYALSWFQARQETEFTRQLPEVVDQIVRLSGAGVPAMEAIAVVAEDAQPPVEPILRGVSDGLVAGLDVDKALQTVSDRVRLADFTLFAAVLRLQRTSGGGISRAFANLSRTLRERRSAAMKAKASTAQTRLTLLVLALMPVLVLVAQKFISPQSVDMLFDTDQGTTLLRAGVGLIVTGLLVARFISARGEQ